MMPLPEDVPDADCRAGAPHPRETPAVFGQEAAEQTLCAALGGGRLHHAWLLTGPAGIGKATLAWRTARYLLAHGPALSQEGGLFAGAGLQAPVTLDVAPDHPVARRMAALAEPRLFLLRRGWNPETKRLRKEITVDDARGLGGFFNLSATDGGYRAVIVDAADDLNLNAANALLKLIEEPPARCIIFLISHRPGGLLPTIRSRCRVLRLASLGPEDLEQALEQAGAHMPEDPAARARLSDLAAGSVGVGWDLLMQDGLDLDVAVQGIFSTLPGHDRRKALRLAERFGAPAKTAERALLYQLVAIEIAALARQGASAAGPGRRAKLAPDARAARLWAEAHHVLRARLAHAEAVNLDPQNVILDMVRRLDEVALRASGR